MVITMRGATRWTPNAVFYVVAGTGLLVAGARLGSSPAVILGGALLLLVSWDALRLHTRSPRVTVAVTPRRVQENGAVEVVVRGEYLQRHHQVHVPLAPGLAIEKGTNIWTIGHDEREQGFLLRARVRGPQSIGPATVRHWSSTRLWGRDQPVSAQESVEVVPRPEDVSRFGLLSRVIKPMQGRFTVNRPGQGFDFFTLRQYHSGDTMRSVNWKATARRDDDLIVNQRQLETHSELLILLDARLVSGVGPVGRTSLDRGCRAALGLFGDAIAQRDTVHFAAYQDGLALLPPGRDDRTLALETLLARLKADGKASLLDAWQECRTKMKSHGPVVVVSSCEADGGLAQAIADMAGRGHPVTVLSPTPAGASWQRDTKRQDARVRALDQARHRGAVVVDWGIGQVVAAEKPIVMGAVP